jgi:hypothetical protein
MPGKVISLAPGIAEAVAWPPASGTIGSSMPWTTRGGNAHLGQGGPAVAGGHDGGVCRCAPAAFRGCALVHGPCDLAHPRLIQAVAGRAEHAAGRDQPLFDPAGAGQAAGGEPRPQQP